jgi:hypothetical protein
MDRATTRPSARPLPDRQPDARSVLDCAFAFRHEQEVQFAVTLPRQRSDFRCLHFVVEYKTISVVLHFEYSFNSEVVAVAQGRGFLSINNNAAATSGSLRPLREVPLVSAATMPSRVTC